MIRIDLVDRKDIVNQITVKDVTNGRTGSKFIQLVNTGGRPLKMQLCSLEKPLLTPFGAKSFDDPKKLSISFDCSDELIEFGTFLDDKILKLANDNLHWFKNNTIPKYNSILDSSKPQYPTRFKSKMNAEWVKTWIINEEDDGTQHQPIPGSYSDINARDHCVPIIKINSIWYVPSTGFGIQSAVTEICVIKKPVAKFAFDLGNAFSHISKRKSMDDDDDDSCGKKMKLMDDDF